MNVRVRYGGILDTVSVDLETPVVSADVELEVVEVPPPTAISVTAADCVEVIVG